MVLGLGPGPGRCCVEARSSPYCGRRDRRGGSGSDRLMQRAARLLTALRCRGWLAAPSMPTAIGSSPSQLRIAAFPGSPLWVGRPACSVLPPSQWPATGMLAGQPRPTVVATARRKASSDATAALEEHASPADSEVQGGVSAPADEPTADTPVKRRRRRKTQPAVHADALQQAELGTAAAHAASGTTGVVGQVRCTEHMPLNACQPSRGSTIPLRDIILGQID